MTQLSNLEHLQPALIAKVDSAELNHLSVELVVGWDVSNQHLVAWLNIRDHKQVHIDTILKLLQGESIIVD